MASIEENVQYLADRERERQLWAQWEEERKLLAARYNYQATEQLIAEHNEKYSAWLILPWYVKLFTRPPACFDSFSISQRVLDLQFAAIGVVPNPSFEAPDGK